MSEDQPRRVLGRYRLLEQIAVGGTARVWRARDERNERDVAVKLLHPHLLPDSVSRRRLAAEARAAEGLSHPGIVSVYDVDTDPAAPALVMELVDGEPLADRLAEGGQMAPRAVARLGAEVADALFHAHRRGIVHRDVTPANILLERGSGRARLVDFGIAHSLAAGSESLTQTGTALGTPRYMAPEQMAAGRVGPRTDLWSLGAVMYRALTGRVPFDGPTPLAIAEQQRSGPPPMPGIDPALASIVTACLSFDIAGRALDASALATALRDWLDGRMDTTTVTQTAAAAAVAGVAEPAPEQVASPVAMPMAGSRPASAGRPRRGLPFLAAAALLAIGIVAVVTVSSLRLGVGEAPATPPPTAAATPDWTAALLADLRQACDERLGADALAGMSRDEAEALVSDRIGECLAGAEGDGDDEGKGRGPKPGHGNGHGRGSGGGNGGGNGEG